MSGVSPIISAMRVDLHRLALLAAMGGLGATACSDGATEMTTTEPDQVVACPCDAAGTVSGTVDGREFTGVATGVMEPSVGSLEITLHEGGEPPTCYESGRAEVRGGSGTRVIISLCIPPMGSRDVGGNGGPVGTHCTERPDSAGVLIADSGVSDSGELMSGGSVDITAANGACVTGSVAASHLTTTGGSVITETLNGTFTVPNASCWDSWTDAVTKFCP